MKYLQNLSLSMLLIIGLITSPVQAQDYTIEDLETDVSTILEELVDHNTSYASGGAITISIDDDYWTYTYGTINSNNVPINPDGKFMYRSYTKMLISILVLQLHEEGLLDIEDSVNDYIGTFTNDFTSAVKSESIKDLLRMNSTLCEFENFALYGYIADGNQATVMDPKQTLIDYMPTTTCNAGRKYFYSNSNFQLLGLLLEEITGESVRDLMMNRIFEPLGLETTALAPVALNPLEYNGLWSRTFNESPVDVNHVSKNSLLTSQMYSAGVVGSSKDMLTILKQLMDGELLESPTLNMMKTIKSPDTDYGLGLMMNLHFASNDSVYGHGGGAFNTTRTYYNPTKDYGYSFALNATTDNGAATDFMEGKKWAILNALQNCYESEACRTSSNLSVYQRKAEWNILVDDYWGAGDPLATKQAIFNEFADNVEAQYIGFEGLNIDWDSLRAANYAKITDSTSKGAFSALMTKTALALDEMHVRTWDEGVIFETSVPKGTPGFALNSYDATPFGASLAVSEEGKIFVLRTLENHPLGLAAGDEILGYDGVLWDDIFAELMESDLPRGGWWASDPKAAEFLGKVNAGSNWHLFNEVDVVKFGTTDTVHLSVDELANIDEVRSLFNNPSLPVAGIPEPYWDPFFSQNGTNSGKVTWGIIDNSAYTELSGTDLKVGYIYLNSHNFNDIDDLFEAAVDELFFQTDDLIIDIRYNAGGYLNIQKGLKKLFNTWTPPLEAVVRCSSDDRFSFCSEGVSGLINTPDWFDFVVDPNTFYDGNIFVLTSPFTQSFGDYAATQLATHPNTTLMGLNTNGAFSGTINRLERTGWHTNTPNFVMVDPENPGELLIRKGVQVDEEVWMSPENAAQGKDDVVIAALSRIATSSEDESMVSTPQDFLLEQNYPNPFNPSTNISFTLPEAGDVSLRVFNMLGQEVANLVNGRKVAGFHTINFDASGLSSGVYIYQLVSGDISQTKKMLLIK